MSTRYCMFSGQNVTLGNYRPGVGDGNNAKNLRPLSSMWSKVKPWFIGVHKSTANDIHRPTALAIRYMFTYSFEKMQHYNIIMEKYGSVNDCFPCDKYEHDQRELARYRVAQKSDTFTSIEHSYSFFKQISHKLTIIAVKDGQLLGKACVSHFLRVSLYSRLMTSQSHVTASAAAHYLITGFHCE